MTGVAVPDAFSDGAALIRVIFLYCEGCIIPMAELATIFLLIWLETFAKKSLLVWPTYLTGELLEENT